MKNKKRNFAPYIIGFWVVVAIPVLIFGMLLFAASNSWAGFDTLPTFEQLENPKSNLASEVYTMDGEILGKYFYQNRVNVKYKDIDTNLVHALISTEDERFSIMKTIENMTDIIISVALESDDRNYKLVAQTKSPLMGHTILFSNTKE